MDTLAALLDGIRLGQPVARGNLTIVPVFRPGADGAPHDYTILADAIGACQAAVTEVSENGSVPTIAVQNSADVALFILDGEELVGARQNRIVNLSILVPKGATLPIPVSCVERGRWSYRSREFRPSPNAYFARGRAAKAAKVSDSLKSFGLRDADQGEVWDNVSLLSASMGVRSRTDAMEDVYHAHRARLDELLDGLAPEPGQVGAVFAIGGTVAGSYAPDALLRRKRKAASFALADAEAFLAAVKDAPVSRFKGVGEGEDIRIEAPDVSGGALVLDGRLVHLAVFRPAAFV